MDPRRTERVSQALREELEEMITYEMKDPRIQAAGVPEVLISPDARHAHVRVLLSGDAAVQKVTLDTLQGARNYLRRELAQRLELFRIPELHFEAAVSAGLAPRMEQLLKRLKRGRHRPDDPSEKKPVE